MTAAISAMIAEICVLIVGSFTTVADTGGE
jgi:hypothetical protein